MQSSLTLLRRRWLSLCRYSQPLVCASSSSSGPAAPSGPPPRPPAKPRADNAPLYESLRRERRAMTERVTLEKRRADLRKRQFDSQAEADGAPPASRLQPARQKLPELPVNCLPWRDYALFTDPPVLQPLKSLEEDSQGGSFASMLRRSSFVGLGDFENRVVRGRIFERFEGNLYVDFGAKFHAVCPAPRVNSEKYVRGAQVTLRLIDPEMTSKFLGSERHVTLAEADAVLLGLAADGTAAAEDDAAAAAAAADAPDTVSPLRQSVMQLALYEAAVAEEATEQGGRGNSGGGDMGGGVGDDFGEFTGV